MNNSYGRMFFNNELSKFTQAVGRIFYSHAGEISAGIMLAILYALAPTDMRTALNGVFQKMPNAMSYYAAIGFSFILKFLMVVSLWFIFLMMFITNTVSCPRDTHKHNRVIYCMCKRLVGASFGIVAYIIIYNSEHANALVSTIVSAVVPK